jgi:hypothetical protein
MEEDKKEEEKKNEEEKEEPEIKKRRIGRPCIIKSDKAKFKKEKKEVIIDFE